MEPIKATVEPTVSYDFTIGGHTFKGFKEDGTWNGMTAFTNNQGTVIVNEFEGGFNDDEPKVGEFQIVKASPFFYSHLAKDTKPVTDLKRCCKAMTGKCNNKRCIHFYPHRLAKGKKKSFCTVWHNCNFVEASVRCGKVR